MPAHAYSNNRAHGSIFGTWSLFCHLYRKERLDDLDYEPRIPAKPFFDARLHVKIELYFQFDLEKRKPQIFSLFLAIMTHQICFIECNMHGSRKFSQGGVQIPRRGLTENFNMAKINYLATPGGVRTSLNLTQLTISFNRTPPTMPVL